MLHFLDQTEFNRRFRTPWMHGNGGGATLLSLCPGIDTPDAVLLGDAYHLTPERCAIPEKYVDFVRNLTFAHHETLPSGLQLVFLHAPPTTPDRTVGNTEVPLAEQLEADTYQHFEALVSRHQLWIEDTQLWNRRLPPVPDTPGERIMFHGHTPTHIILEDETYRPYRPKQFPGHGTLPYLHTCRRTVPAYDEAARHLAMDAPLSELISVHLDTGCAYGIALTAICFTDDMLHDPVAPGFHIFRACSELMRNPRDAMQPHQVVFR
jgi:hypothetical protein